MRSMLMVRMTGVQEVSTPGHTIRLHSRSGQGTVLYWTHSVLYFTILYITVLF